MRTLLLLFLTIAILIGLPRLADRFREAPAETTLHSRGTQDTAVAKTGQESRPLSIYQAPAVKDAGAVPAPLPPVRPALSKPLDSSIPNSEPELISAISRELVRTGYYDGSPSARWSKKVRLAARRFSQSAPSGLPYRTPTQKLLLALRAAPSRTAGATQEALQRSQGSLNNATKSAAQNASETSKLRTASHRKYKSRSARHMRYRSARYHWDTSQNWQNLYR